MKLVVAVSKDNVIAIDGDMPWDLPSDLQHFKRETLGSTILMGRKTFDTLGKPLPGRRNVVFSRNLVRRDIPIERTFSRMKMYEDAVVIGGAEVYNHALQLEELTELVVTVIDVDYSDTEERRVTRFPKIDTNIWKINRMAHYQLREGDSHKYSVVRYVRRVQDEK